MENQANLDRGIVEMFEVSGEEIRYGMVWQMPYMFQDDIMRVVDSTRAAWAGHTKVAAVMGQKQLQLNIE